MEQLRAAILDIDAHAVPFALTIGTRVTRNRTFLTFPNASSPMSDPQPCGICHTSPHRFGTTDPYHSYDAMGCVNSLLGAIERFVAAYDEQTPAIAEFATLRRIARGSPDE
jgi:hypothetical protein